MKSPLTQVATTHISRLLHKIQVNLIVYYIQYCFPCTVIAVMWKTLKENVQMLINYFITFQHTVYNKAVISCDNI